MRHANQKAFLILSLFVGLFLLFSLPLFSATYYVQNGGDDEAAGTEGAPWANCPGMGAWSPGASGNSISANDTVYFDMGDTWSSASNYVLSVTGGVTYIGDTWGSGTRAIFVATANLGRSVIWFGDDDATYSTVVQGFEADGGNFNCGAGVGFNYQYAYQSLTGATKRAENCVIHDLENATGFNYGVMIHCKTTYTDTDNVEIIDCEIYNTARSGIVVYPASDSVDHEITNVLLRGNIIHDTGEDSGSAGYGIAFKNHSSGSIAESNYIYDTPGIGICFESSGDGFTSAEDCVVRYNLIKSCGGGFLIREHGGKSIEIYANLVIENGTYGIIVESTLNDNLSLKVYNNTFYQNCQSTGSAELYIYSTSATITTLELKNNIIFGTEQPLKDIDADITAHSNNDYYRSAGDLVLSDGSTYTSANLSTYEATAIPDDPKFIDAVSADFHLLASSPCVDKGVDVGLTQDYEGNPVGALPDIGAYELLGLIPPIFPYELRPAIIPTILPIIK